jgi:hypothetical protein
MSRVSFSEMFNLCQVVAKLRPDWEPFQELIEGQDTKAEHFCVHGTPKRFKHTAQCKAQVGSVADQVLVNE